MGNQQKVARDVRKRHLHFPKKNRRGTQTARTSALPAFRLLIHILRILDFEPLPAVAPVCCQVAGSIVRVPRNLIIRVYGEAQPRGRALAGVDLQQVPIPVVARAVGGNALPPTVSA